MKRAIALCLATALVGGCYRSSNDPALTARIQTLETRVAQQERELAAMRQQANSAELGVLAQKIDQLQARLEQLRDQAPSRPPIVRRQPDDAVTYAVPIGPSPQLGSPKAKVTMVMIFEFACPYCRRAWDTVDDLRKHYGKDLRVVYKQYVVHPQTATAAANASCAAHKQGRWREMAELLWVKAFDARQFDQANIDAIANEVGLQPSQYQADIAGVCPQEIADDKALMAKLAVAATPTFFINGRHMSGARPIDDFKRLIDAEMAKANAAIKRGVRPEKLYDQEVVGKGVAEVPKP